jgi:hypothetical protein
MLLMVELLLKEAFSPAACTGNSQGTEQASCKDYGCRPQYRFANSAGQGFFKR